GQDRLYSGKVVGISWWSGIRSRDPHWLWEEFPDWTDNIDIGERFLVSLFQVRRPLDMKVGEPVEFTARPIVHVSSDHGEAQFSLDVFYGEEIFRTGATESCQLLVGRLVLFLTDHKVDFEKHHRSPEYLERLGRELDGDYDLWVRQGDYDLRE
ncbi:MAG: hypothetical protein Q8P59_06085, partial [Dehalococcoidia bacterium]|nr:hypothetical protein [Dehalococcoidia bacterium]